MAFADDRGAEREDRPVGRNHANLGEQIDAERASDGEKYLREPEGKRRPEVAAELKLVPDRQHERHLVGGRGIEQRRNDQPERGLRERCCPEHGARLGAQQLDEQGNRKHRRDDPLPWYAGKSRLKGAR